MSADFTPSLNTYTDLTPFRFWCQKILPIAYDDSLSYYELLCKVVDYLNKTMEDVELSIEDVEKLHDAYEDLQEYVNDYFTNLDVQVEINNKLDALVADGTIHTIFSPDVMAILTQAQAATQQAINNIPTVVGTWLGQHVTQETGYVIDDSLSTANAAADALATGVADNNIKSAIDLALFGEIEDDDFVQGYRTQADYYTVHNQTTRCTSAKYYHVYKDDTVTISDIASGTKTAILGTYNNYDSGWKTSDFTYTSTAEQIVFVECAKSDDSEDILVSDVTTVITLNDKSTRITRAENDIGELKSELGDAFVYSPNLYNPSENVEGLLGSTGNILSQYTTYTTSGFIPVNATDVLRAQYNYNGVREDSGTSNRWAFYKAAFYDSSFTYLSDSTVTSQKTLTAPASAKYVRFSMTNSALSDKTDIAVIISNSSTIIPCTPYGTIVNLKESKIPASYDEHINSLIGSYDGYSISPKETTFFHISKNMIDPSAQVENEYVNQANGTFQSGNGYFRTGYIEIQPSTEYVVRTVYGATGNNFRYAFYTENKTYISGAAGSVATMVLESPATAKYIAVSNTDNMSVCMISKYENEDKSFEYFENIYVLPQYIKESAEDVVLNVPQKFFAYSGYELNIYFENITEDWEKYEWNVDCNKGKQMERGYTITPADTDVGTYDLSITVKVSEKAYKTVQTSLVIKPSSAGSGETVSMIILGDSTTANGIAVSKINANFENDAMHVTMLGTRGTAPNKHEGRSGWKFIDYFTRSVDPADASITNPFYNPTTQTFDASYYFTTTEVSVPDWFFINLGINDMFGYVDDTALAAAINMNIGYCDAMIDSVKDVSDNIKIGVCLTIPPNHSQDAFGKAYQCAQTRDRYKRNNALWVNRLVSEYDDREDEDIYLVPLFTNLDTIYNMGMESMPVNARNTAMTYNSPIGNGGVHPVESGYWQIADVYTAFLKGNVN